MENFVYLLGSKSSRECFVVDPAWDIRAIEHAAAADGMTITGCLVTHYHPDHCGGHLWGHDIEGVAELVGRKPVPVYVNAEELEGVQKITGLSRGDFKPCRSGDVLEVGGVKITTIHTPGHTPGSQCFLCDGALVSGDTLFLSGCGRVDLPGGSSEQLFESLSGKLAKLPPQTTVYPGHNYDSKSSASVDELLKTNPYLGAKSLSDWNRLFRRF
jgi:glyoxylase-like metal-dependent hydrolase (beta-lactamase superfamily II)